MRKYAQALAHWQTALEIAPAAPEVIQNLGRLLHLMNDPTRQQRLNVPAGMQRRFSDLYAAAAVSVSPDARAFDSRTGWLYMAPMGKQSASGKDADQRTALTKTGLTIRGHATGFVVQPEYVLTNRHVIQDEYTGRALCRVVSCSTRRKKSPVAGECGRRGRRRRSR